MKKLTGILTTLILSTTSLAYAQSNPSPAEVADLTFMIQEEKLAHDVYVKLGEKYSSMPFMNIPKAEQRHEEALGRLLDRFSLPNPNDGKSAGEFADATLQKLYTDLTSKGLASELAAASIGGLIEEKDIEDLHQVMKRTQNANLLAVYEKLDCGSRNHLRAFSGLIERLSGKPYTAQILSQGEVDQIMKAPHERCGGAGGGKGGHGGRGGGMGFANGPRKGK